jgi:hypothetical protein
MLDAKFGDFGLAEVSVKVIMSSTLGFLIKIIIKLKIQKRSYRKRIKEFQENSIFRDRPVHSKF